MTCPTCGTVYTTEIRFCPNDGSVLRSAVGDTDELVGRVIDERYFLEKKIGQGGMGEVYLGEHVRTRRQCAVKVINRALARDPEALNRFIREATNAGRINHPHVAGVYDFGETDDGLLYLAMEYVDGDPLSKLLEREGALSPARAVEIARQVADAVGAAHELGIIHRDLKPSNIMVARDRRGGDLVKVVDFGIARTVGDEQQRLTRTGLVIGTPEYMSPEQLIGDPVEARTDIYSLGCILYQMLTGEHAFGGTTAHVITRRLTEPPPRPRAKNPEIPKSLDEVIVTALGRTPAERFPTMDAMREALLAAPTQPVTTGPRRIAAWLGLGSITGEKTVESPPPPTLDTPLEPAANGPVAPVSTDGITPGSAFPAPAGEASIDADPEALDEARQVPADESEPAYHFPLFDGEIEEPRQDVVDASFSPDTDDPGSADETSNSVEDVRVRLGSAYLESEEDYRRRRGIPKSVLVAAVLAVLILGFVILVPERGAVGGVDLAEQEPWPVEPVSDEPPPDVSPPDTIHLALANFREQLALADEENSNLNFAAAIGRLRGVGSQLSALVVENPSVPEVQTLADSARVELERIEARCRALERVERDRGATPPVCEPGS